MLADDLWSTLSVDVLVSIVRRLDTADEIRFGAVCQSWRSALLLSISHLPHLARGPIVGPNRVCVMSLLFPPLGRRETIRLPHRKTKACLGSFQSSLIMKKACGCSYLLNPFTGIDQQRLLFPKSLCTADLRLAFSWDPIAAGYDIVATNHPVASFLYRRAGSNEWSAGNVKRGRKTFEIVAVDGSCGKFYALTESISMRPWGIVTMYGLVEIDLRGETLVRVIEEATIELWHADHVYLVESEGELLAVIVKCTSRPLQAVMAFMCECRIMKFDAVRLGWLEVDSIGDRTLFVGPRGSVSIAGGGGRIYVAGKDCFTEYKLVCRFIRAISLGIPKCWCLADASTWPLWVFLQDDGLDSTKGESLSEASSSCYCRFWSFLPKMTKFLTPTCATL